MKQMKIQDLQNESIAFLNGEPGLHSIDEEIFNSFSNAGVETGVIDNLFAYPEKISKVKLYDNLAVFTTGLNGDKIEPLVNAFEKLDYVPNRVVFISEETALTFSRIARSLKKRGTKFYFVDFIDKATLYEVNWI